tara:strand:- start:50 stop:322 length:273 start_codon:yes stop_codon:yes gene_type:complete
MVALKLDIMKKTTKSLIKNMRRRIVTQYKDKVEARKLQLEEEAKSRQTVAIDTRYKNGLWYKQIIDYADGRRVTEYRDKRRATIEEYIDG